MWAVMPGCQQRRSNMVTSVQVADANMMIVTHGANVNRFSIKNCTTEAKSLKRGLTLSPRGAEGEGAEEKR